MALRCEKSLIPLTCREEVVEQCIYCEKHFCMKHGHLDKVVCKSNACMRRYKRDRAIADRAAWEEDQRLVGMERNSGGLCGQHDCPNPVYVTCGHCEVRFCSNHVSRYNFSFTTHTRRSKTRVKGNLILCYTCKPHLKEYERDRYE